MTHRTDTVCFDCAACRSRHASIREACEARRDARDATRIEGLGYPAWIVSYVSCDGRGLPYSVGFEAATQVEAQNLAVAAVKAGRLEPKD